MNTPLVTVLTAVRNGARHLPATIESIQQQTFADWVYIVVDDNSTAGQMTQWVAFPDLDPGQ